MNVKKKKTEKKNKKIFTTGGSLWQSSGTAGEAASLRIFSLVARV